MQFPKKTKTKHKSEKKFRCQLGFGGFELQRAFIGKGNEAFLRHKNEVKRSDFQQIVRLHHLFRLGFYFKPRRVK